MNHLFSRLLEEERKCDSLQSLYSSISNKENELIENIKTIKFELDTLKTPDQTITIEGRPPNRSDVPQFDNSKTPDQPITNGNEPPKRNDMPQLDKSQKFTQDYQDCDIVLLMDSNRRFIDTNRLFPGKKVLTIPCGSITAAFDIIDNPYFKGMDALFIHTGVNDVENDLLDAKTIADHLTKVVLNAREKFPETKLFLSEVTPRSDSLNEKILKINSLLINCLFNISNLKLVIHSNLADQIYFYDDKHFNRYKGIPSLARNLQSCYFNRNQISTHSIIPRFAQRQNIFHNRVIHNQNDMLRRNNIYPSYQAATPVRTTLPSNLYQPSGTPGHFQYMPFPNPDFSLAGPSVPQHQNFRQSNREQSQGNSYSAAVRNHAPHVVSSNQHSQLSYPTNINQNQVFFGELLKQLQDMNKGLNTLITSRDN